MITARTGIAPRRSAVRFRYVPPCCQIDNVSRCKPRESAQPVANRSLMASSRRQLIGRIPQRRRSTNDTDRARRQVGTGRDRRKPMTLLGTLLKNRRAGETHLAWNLPNLQAPELLSVTSQHFEAAGSTPSSHQQTDRWRRPVSAPDLELTAARDHRTAAGHRGHRRTDRQARRTLPGAHRPVPTRRIIPPCAAGCPLSKRSCRWRACASLHRRARLPRPRADQGPRTAPLHLPAVRPLLQSGQTPLRDRIRLDQTPGPPGIHHGTGRCSRLPHRHLRTLTATRNRYEARASLVRMARGISKPAPTPPMTGAGHHAWRWVSTRRWSSSRKFESCLVRSTNVVTIATFPL